MQSFSQFILRRAGWIALIGTLLAFWGAIYSVRLYKNLRTGFEELLPTHSRSVLDLGEVTHRLKAIDNLGVLIFSREPEASRRFVEDLAARLRLAPRGVVSSVEYRIEKELRFFRDREALYMDIGDLKRIRDYVSDRIEYEKELHNPLTLLRSEEISQPRLDFGTLKRKYEKGLSAYSRFPEGYYATPDETKRVVLVYLPGEASNIDLDEALKKTVTRAVSSLNPASYAPDMTIRYTGSVEETLEEHDALLEDLELSTVIVMVLVTVAMFVFYRNIRSTIALVTSLFAGTIWTFGVAYFVVGYLNANSAFLGSIVIGNGINFGIIVLARYLEERRKGRHHGRACMISMKSTVTSTLTAALAAGLSYGSLILTGFRGFRQFGIIGLMGMILCWISAFTLLPAYLTVLDRIYPLVRRARIPSPPRVAGLLAWAVGRFPRALWGLSILATAVSLAMLSRYSPDILETDLSQLRNRHSLQNGAAYLSRYLDEIFQRYLSPMVILPRTNEQARRIAELLKEKKASEGSESLISSVQTLDDYVPKDQTEKITVLREIRKLLPPKVLYHLPLDDQKEAEEFLNPEVFRPIQQNDLPPLLLRKFTEKDGSTGKLVLVEPQLAASRWHADKISRFVSELRQVADSVAPGTPVAGSMTITADMIDAISRDGPKATLSAFLAVTILVILLFRNLRTIVLVLFSLVVGVTWLAGLILGFWIKINFLNFIALPITFGIGVDYGVNIFHRYQQEGGGNILKVIRNTGGAVLLASFTTVVGYCSLLIASNKAFVSFGLLAVAGELTCVTAAVVSLPAFLLWMHTRRMKALATKGLAPGARNQENAFPGPEL